jgi:tRNA (guanine37-N1)-methyltransferase
MFSGPFSQSVIKRAMDKGIVNLFIHNLRDFTHDKHRTVDDYPFGGGAGMILKPEPIFKAVESLRGEGSEVILLSPQGLLFNQEMACSLSTKEHLILLCGRYEGVDERVREHLVTLEVSIGDYVLMGGEVAAMVVVEAVVRLLPGVVSAESLKEESLTEGLLEYPQYTRPALFRGWGVPPILLSGNHAAIAQWRREQALIRTLKRRPDLLQRAKLSPEDREFLRKVREKWN